MNVILNNIIFLKNLILMRELTSTRCEFENFRSFSLWENVFQLTYNVLRVTDSFLLSLVFVVFNNYGQRNAL